MRRSMNDGLPIPSRNELGEAVIVRALPEDLEAALADMPRTIDRTKAMMRHYFVQGLTSTEIAALYGTSHQKVLNSVRLVRIKLKQQASPMQYVRTTLSLPMALATSLQDLADEIGNASKPLAEQTLAPVLQAVHSARKKLSETENTEKRM